MRRTGAAQPEGIGRGGRPGLPELAVLFALALIVRVGYVLLYKHPVGIGGDAYWYHYGANLLVDGHGFIDAYRFAAGHAVQTADHPPGTIVVLAAASLLGMRSFFWHQLEMCVLGSATVVVIAVTARQVAGRLAGLAAGAIAVIYPNLWLNDALVMSETLVQLTTAVAVLAAYRWWAAPSRRRAAVLGVAVAACALTRAEAVLFVPLLVAPLILLDRRHRWRERALQVALSAVVAGLVVAPWVGYNLSRFQQPVTISTGFDPTSAVSNCNAVYYGPYTGYWSWPCIRSIPPPTKGDLSTQEAYYRHVAFRYVDAHLNRVPVVVVARVGRTFALFHPVQQIKLDRGESRELQFSAIGLTMYYALVAGTVAACFLLRRRRVPLAPIVAPVVVVAIATAVTFGQTRYRASAEVILVLGGGVALAALARRLVGRRPGKEPVPGDDGAADAEGEPASVTAGAPGGSRRAFPCFDGLRALAAVSVVLVHTAFPSGFTMRSGRWGAYTARLEIGVAVFFLISGFLLYRPFVAAHLAGRAPPSLRRYLKRRLLRIVPAYWVALFFAAYVLHTVSLGSGIRPVVVYFGFLQIYFPRYVLHGISAAWTLCVEMTFYLFLPVYAAGVAAWGRRAAADGRRLLRCEIAGVVGLFALSLAYKAVVYATPQRAQTGAGTWLPAQLDLFALGMALSVASVWWSEHRREPAVLGRRFVPAAAWLCAVGVFWVVSTHAGLPRVPVWQATVMQIEARQLLYGAFAVFLLLPAVFGRQERGVVRAFLRWRPVVWVGLVSYGVYLWHETWITEVLRWLHRPLFTAPFFLLTCAVLALSLAVAGVSYRLVEQPLQQLGRLGRLRPRRPSVPAATPAPAVEH